MIKPRAEISIFGQLADEFIATGIGFRFQARGRSMLPTIQDGEMLYVESATAAKLGVGDIVLFRTQRNFVAHRIIRKHKYSFITRGDACVTDDGEIRGEQILAKVVAKECHESGRVISLDGTSAHILFWACEFKRRVVAFARMLVSVGKS